MDARFYAWQKAAYRTLLYLTIGCVAAVMVFPVCWMYLTSFKTSEAISTTNPIWPSFKAKNYTLDHYKAVLGHAMATGDDFLIAAFNSTVYTILSTSATLLVCSMAAYVLAKKRFRGDMLVLYGIVATMMIPAPVTMIPTFWIVVDVLKGYNTFWGLIVPGMANATGIFLLRQYMLSIPNDLIDAAKIDGCGDIRIFLTLIIPLTAPMLAAFGILNLMGHWNELIWPLLLTKDLTLLPVAMLNLAEIGSQSFGPVMVGAVLTATPMIFAFLVARRYFISGLTSGALKM
jgi:ABC-type glycerol-3-phosphate transport system permease component